MRRLLVVLVVAAALLVTAGLVWRSQPVVAAYAPLGPGDSYLALGDSLAAGFTVGDPSEAYVARLGAGLRALQPGIAVKNFAVPGETSASFRARQMPRAIEYLKAERAAGRRVSPITIDIGGNDARAAERGSREQRLAAMRRVEANLGRSLDELLVATRDRSGKRTADVVVMNYYNPFGGDPADEESPAYWTAQLNRAIERAAAARGVPVADVATAFSGGRAYRYTYITTGDIHANADGHRVIAEQFWRALAYPGNVVSQG